METLQYYNNPNQLYIYTLYHHIIQKIHQIKLSSNPQLNIKEIDDCELDYFCYQRNNKKKDGLAIFLDRYKDDMISFIPVYY